jgi:GWxTD domain-containing protein
MKEALQQSEALEPDGLASRARALIIPVLILMIFWGAALTVWSPAASANDADTKTPSKREKRKLSREEKRRAKAIRKEMESPYKEWLEDEVPYIITPQEKAAFKKLTTDNEREQFIQAFWERRNPNPGSPENEFKEEYYRRIAYANEHFSSGIPGWRTDRGRIYIMYGPPDEIDAHPSGGSYVRPPCEGGGETSTYPFSDWTYHYIPGIGENVKLEFVDPTMSGEYHLTMDPGEKDALLHVPGAGLTEWEEMNGGSKLDRFQRTDGTTLGTPMAGEPESMEEFTRLDTFAKIFQPPQVKFNDLRAVVTHQISAQLLPFKVKTDYVRITDQSILTPITVQIANKDLEFQNKDGVMHGVVDIYGQLSTLGGRIADSFEQTAVLDVPQHDFSSYVNRQTVYQKAVMLAPGRYKLSLVLKDDTSGHMGSTNLGIIVPRYDDSDLSSSSLILADLIQQLPTDEVGTGPFVIGGTKVRPSVTDSFKRDQNLGMYLQVYNLAVDPKTHRPNADIQYQLLRNGKTIFTATEPADKIQHASEQVTIRKRIPLAPLQPGDYTVAIKVTDNIKKTSIQPTATFAVH